MTDNTYLQPCDSCAETRKNATSRPVAGSYIIPHLSSDDNCETCKGTRKSLTEQGKKIAEVVEYLKIIS